MGQVRFVCHDCGEEFDVDVDNRWDIYEFMCCPACGSARTTLAAQP